MTDCLKTTVLMRLGQFHTDELHNMAHDFDDTHDAQYAEKVWWALHGAVGTIPDQPELKKAWKEIPENISKRGILRMEAGASMPPWIPCLHRRNILAVGNASGLQTQGSGGSYR